MRNPKKHKIKTIQHIVNIVNKDNIDNFIIDFRHFLDAVIATKDFNNSNKQNKTIIKELYWTDDGKHDNKITVDKRKS